MKKEGFIISYRDQQVNVQPVFLDDMIHYRVQLPEGDKFLRLEENEAKKLTWFIRGEGHTAEAEIIGNLIELKVM